MSRNKVWQITVSTTVEIDSEDDYCESQEHAEVIMWDRWNVYKHNLDRDNIKYKNIILGY